MSLMGALRMAANTLRVDQIAVQVMGQNISNANTPGYIREEVELVPAQTQRVGGLLLGMGVQITGIIQKIDNFLEERLHGAVTDRAAAEAQEEAYSQLEGVLDELTGTDLSTSMNMFFGSIAKILNQPEDVSVRNLAVLQGGTLAGDIQRMARRATEVRNSLNDRVADMGERINRLTQEIAELNVQIAETEGGNVSHSDAVGLRDQRLQALDELATLINIRVTEQESGGITVYCGGDFLVTEGTQRPVEVVYESRDGMAAASVQLKQTQSPLELSGGELQGLMIGRDEILGRFLDDLDGFARALAFEFNKVFSGGQGLTGYKEVTSEFPVENNKLPLNDPLAGLKFTPSNGSFQVIVRNTQTGTTKTTNITVDLNGMGQDTTLTDLITQLNAIPGLSATEVNGGHLQIKATGDDSEFAFSNDTSGVLAALGINTFFSGSSALDIGVSTVMQNDPGKFAASQGGIGEDTDNAIILANFLDEPLASQSGNSIGVLYNRLVAGVAQGSSVARATAEGTRVFEETLRAQKNSISGVNIDEETINMMSFQYSFQATSKYIKTIQGLLETLLSI